MKRKSELYFSGRSFDDENDSATECDSVYDDDGRELDVVKAGSSKLWFSGELIRKLASSVIEGGKELVRFLSNSVFLRSPWRLKESDSSPRRRRCRRDDIKKKRRKVVGSESSESCESVTITEVRGLGSSVGAPSCSEGSLVITRIHKKRGHKSSDSIDDVDFGQRVQNTIKNLIKKKTWVNELLKEVEATCNNLKVSHDVVSVLVEPSSSASSHLNIISIDEIVSPMYPNSSSDTVTHGSSDDFLSQTSHQVNSNSRTYDERKSVPKERRYRSNASSQDQYRHFKDKSRIDNDEIHDKILESHTVYGMPEYLSECRLSVEEREVTSQERNTFEEGSKAVRSRSYVSQGNTVVNASNSTCRMKSNETRDSAATVSNDACCGEKHQQKSSSGETSGKDKLTSRNPVQSASMPNEQLADCSDGASVGTGLNIVRRVHSPRLNFKPPNKAQKYAKITSSFVAAKDLKSQESSVNGSLVTGEQIMKGEEEMDSAQKKSVEQSATSNNNGASKTVSDALIAESGSASKEEEKVVELVNQKKETGPVEDLKQPARREKSNGNELLVQDQLIDPEKKGTKTVNREPTNNPVADGQADRRRVPESRNMIEINNMADEQGNRRSSLHLQVLSDWNVVSSDQYLDGFRRDSFRRSGSISGPIKLPRQEKQVPNRRRSIRGSVSAGGAKEYLMSFKENRADVALVQKASPPEPEGESPREPIRESLVNEDRREIKNSDDSENPPFRQYFMSDDESIKEKVATSDESPESDSTWSIRKGFRSPEKQGVSFARESSLKTVYLSSFGKADEDSPSDPRLPPISEETEPHEMVSLSSAILSGRRKSVISRPSESSTVTSDLSEFDEYSLDGSLPSRASSVQPQCRCRTVCNCCTCALLTKKTRIERTSTLDNKTSSDVSALVKENPRTHEGSIDFMSPPYPKSSLAVLSSPFYANWSYYDIDIDHPLSRYLKRFDNTASEGLDCVMLKNVRVGGYYMPFLNVCQKQKVSPKVICNYYKNYALKKNQLVVKPPEVGSSSSVIGAPAADDVPICKCKDDLWAGYAVPKDSPAETDVLEVEDDILEAPTTAICCDDVANCKCLGKKFGVMRLPLPGATTSPCPSCECFISQVASESTSKQSVIQTEVEPKEESIASKYLVNEYISNLQELCGQLCAMIGRMRFIISETSSVDSPVVLMPKKESIAPTEELPISIPE